MKKISFVAFMVLLSFGIEVEILSLYFSDLDISHYLYLLSGAIGPLVLYGIPMIILGLYLARRFNVDQWTVLLGLVAGWFIAGPLAGIANTSFLDYLSAALPIHIYEPWQDSLSAPFVEEFLKAVVAIWVISFFRDWRLETAFLVGAASGLGFQLTEDIAYVINQSYQDLNQTYAELFNRFSGFLASHWAYTAMVVTGVIWLLKHRSEMRSFFPYLLIIGPPTLHFLWNSPINGTETVSIVRLTLTTATLFLTWETFFRVMYPASPDTTLIQQS